MGQSGRFSVSEIDAPQASSGRFAASDIDGAQKDPASMSDLERTVLGLPPKDKPSTLRKVVDWSTTSVVPGLTQSIRERDAAARAKGEGPFANVPIMDRWGEAVTQPLGLAGEILGLLPLLRGLRGAPAAAPAVDAVEAVAAAPKPRIIAAPSKPPVTMPGFAEPPILMRPQVAPTIPRGVLVEPPPTTLPAASKPRYSAADVVEFLKKKQAANTTPNAVTTAANDVTPGGSVVFDTRLQGSGRFKLPEAKVDDVVYEVAAKRMGIEPVKVPPSVDEAATMQGRAGISKKLPEGTTLADDQTKLLDDLGKAYRTADQNLADVEKLFFEGRTTSENLGKAKLARREAGKALKQAEVKIVKEAEAAIKNAASGGSTLYAGFPINLQLIRQHPQLFQAAVGGTVGANTGAALDEENPARGALIGALSGALLPGTAIGTAKSLKSQGLKTVGKVYISSLLSGPMTMARNVTSTAANGLFRVASHPFAVGYDRAVSKAGQRSVTINDITPAMVATWSGFKTGATDALKAFTTGQSPYRGLFSNAPPTTEMAGGLGNAFNYPGRALDALDTWLGRIVEHQTIASTAYTEAVNQGMPVMQRFQHVGRMQGAPSAKIQSMADAEARRVLFRGDPGKLTQVLSQVRNTLNNMPGKLPIGDFLSPFIRIPATIAKQAIELSPAGLLQSTAAMNPRQKAEHMGRIFAGSMFMLKGAELALEGRVSGSGPTNPAERAKLMETGWRPYAINLPIPMTVAKTLGGTQADDGTFWVPTNALGPLGMMLGTVGDMAEGWKDSGGRDNATLYTRAAETAGRLGHAFTDQTFLSDAVDLAEALDNPSRIARYLDRKAGSLVPAVVRQFARSEDPVVRDPQGPIESIKANIPGLSTSVPARTDRFGQEVVRPTADAPTPQHPAREVVESAGAKLSKSQGRITVTEPRLRAALETAGFEFDENNVITLTPGEKRALQQRRAKQTADILASLKKSQTYTALPKEAQAIIIERLKGKLETDRRMPELLELLQQRKAAGVPK